MMQFPTVAYAVFFIAAFTVNWLLRPYHLVWRATMVAFSLYFCGWVDVRFAVVAVGMAVVNAGLASAAHRARRRRRATPASRRLVRLAVVLDLAVLGLFAYHGFFTDSVSGALSGIGLSAGEPTLDLVVPVGLSFLTLYAIGYVIDVGRGDVEPVAFADLLLYLTFFPHLVAGPVVRVDELVPQFHERPDPRRVPATEAFVLVAVGLAKAVVVAGYLGSEVVGPAFGAPDAAGGAELAFAACAFAVQVYAGFSGLADVAVGSALLLGIEYPRAFDAPYRSLSVREFWDRWNTTVSAWMRDYVYVTLGGNRRGTATTYRNLLVTMVLGGLWYGAGWTFVAWGALHGTFLVGERAASAWAAARRGAGDPGGPDESEAGLVRWWVADGARWALTFGLVTAAWVVYRADSLADAGLVLRRIVTLAPGSTGTVTALAVVVVAGSLAGQFVEDHHTARLRAGFSSLRPAAQAALLAAGLTLIGALGPDGAVPFAYLPF
jgi:D-alanyl-lipoteichoic acid acyltransferase DltB (MBOAT superfamily)